MRTTTSLASIIAMLILVQVSGCKMPGPNSMKMALPGSGSDVRIPTLITTNGGKFYANGFPTDLRKDEQDKIDISDFPRQYHWLTHRYVSSITRHADGYHTVMPIYLPFTQPIDMDNMSKQDLDYLQPDSPIQLIDVDPQSPEYGRRFPLDVSMTKVADQYRPSNLLQIYPTMGINLRPNTTYAVIVSRDTPLKAMNYWEQNPQLAAVLDPDIGRIELPDTVLNAYKPLRDYLVERKTDTASIVGATVWTTGAPLEKFYKGSAAVAKKAEALETLPVRAMENIDNFPEYCVIRGSVDIPGYQKGVVPFVFSGGGIEWNEDGSPVEQYTRTTEFILTIPKEFTMPENGFPLLSYVHGAAGTAKQVYERGDFDHYDITRYPYYIAKIGEGPSQIAAERGWASSGLGGHLSVDHLPQWDVATIAIGFNPYNPDAFGNNYVTITWEQVFFRRIVERIRIDASLCPEADPGEGRTAFRFDTDKEVSMGQSLGVWGAALKVASDPKPYSGLIVGGSGGTWAKTLNSSSVNRAGMRFLILNQMPFQSLDDAHPFLMLAEWAFAPVDLTVSLEAMMVYPTKSPPHVLGYSGIRDEIFPDTAQRISFMSLRSDLVGDDIGDKPGNTFLPHITIAGVKQLSYPVSGNFPTPFGDRLNAVMRYPGKNPALLYSGHEVMFEDGEIKHQYGCFLEYIGNDESPVLNIGYNQGDPCL